MQSGFNGGKTEEFLKMSEVIADRVTKDLEKVLLHYGMMNHI